MSLRRLTMTAIPDQAEESLLKTIRIHTNLPSLVLSLLAAASPLVAGAAEPLAQQYAVVHKVRDLNDPAKAVCVGTPDILQGRAKKML